MLDFLSSLSPFSCFESYISELRHLALDSYEIKNVEDEFKYALNGGPSRELRRVISIEHQRKYGAFFTSTQLGDYLISKIKPHNNKIFYDPSCGMGDLLLAVARKLPISTTFKNTIKKWGEQLTGADLHSEFIDGTKARLIMLARKKHNIENLEHLDWNTCFPNIRVSDGLSDKDAFLKASIILMNPPFGRVNAFSDCDWAAGQVSESAIFVIKAIENSRIGTEIVSILPDVLRSGTNYQKWRNKVSNYAAVQLLEPYGLFDKTTDVDVFVLKLRKRKKICSKSNNRWSAFEKVTTSTINDFFNVNVGRVVPHRDKRTGTQYSYIHPRCVPSWSIISEFSESIKHKGIPFEPPFVVIRRTSRPGDLYRANASVISGNKPVAVENHLIVCRPIDGKLKTCKKLMNELRKDYVNNFLNERIRCRHLTVNSVKMIPYSNNRF